MSQELIQHATKIITLSFSYLCSFGKVFVQDSLIPFGLFIYVFLNISGESSFKQKNIKAFFWDTLHKSRFQLCATKFIIFDPYLPALF